MHDIQDVISIMTKEDTTDPPGDGGEVTNQPTDSRLILSYHYFKVPRMNIRFVLINHCSSWIKAGH